jgi:hypothetical protein
MLFANSSALWSVTSANSKAGREATICFEVVDWIDGARGSPHIHRLKSWCSAFPDKLPEWGRCLVAEHIGLWLPLLHQGSNQSQAWYGNTQYTTVKDFGEVMGIPMHSIEFACVMQPGPHVAYGKRLFIWLLQSSFSLRGKQLLEQIGICDDHPLHHIHDSGM